MKGTIGVRRKKLMSGRSLTIGTKLVIGRKPTVGRKLMIRKKLVSGRKSVHPPPPACRGTAKVAYSNIRGPDKESSTRNGTALVAHPHLVRVHAPDDFLWISKKFLEVQSYIFTDAECPYSSGKGHFCNKLIEFHTLSRSHAAHSRADTTYDAHYSQGLMAHSAHDLDDLKAKDPKSLSEQEKVILSLAYDAESRSGHNNRERSERYRSRRWL